MKSLCCAICVIILSGMTCIQTSTIVGSWNWYNAQNQASLFIKKNGTVYSNFSQKGKVLFPEDLVRGKYTFNDSILKVVWSDSTIEEIVIKFISENEIEIKKMKNIPGQHLFFRRVVDELQ